jgi:DNA-directed RNA polymerase specialized sigma24 family protein
MINKWITDNYQDLRKTLLNITHNDIDRVDDLLHEVILIFMKKSIAEDLIINKSAKFYIIRIALNQYRSKTSKFYKEHKKDTGDFQLVEAITNEKHLTDYNYELDEMLDITIKIIEELLKSTDSKDRYHGMLMMLYFSNGHNFAEVARCLNIPRTTIRRQFDDASKVVLNKMKNYKDNELIEYNGLPLKILATKILKGYGRGRRY